MTPVEPRVSKLENLLSGIYPSGIYLDRMGDAKYTESLVRREHTE
jgi:hypothetical protein